MNSRVLRLSSLSILIVLTSGSIIAASAASATILRYTTRPAEELYDLTSDPDELHNLATDPRQVTCLASLRTDLDAWMQQQGDTQTVFGKPLLEGEPVTLIAPGNAKKK